MSSWVTFFPEKISVLNKTEICIKLKEAGGVHSEGNSFPTAKKHFKCFAPSSKSLNNYSSLQFMKKRDYFLFANQMIISDSHTQAVDAKVTSGQEFFS